MYSENIIKILSDFYREILIVCLLAYSVYGFLKIGRLKKALIKERKKRLTPLLSLEMDEDRLLIYIKNISDIWAREIEIEDTDIIFDFGIKSSLHFKFEPIDQLRPDEKLPLNYRVFDKEYEIDPATKQSLATKILYSSFELNLRFSNFENMPFEEKLLKETKKTKILEISSIQETSPPD